MKLSRASKNLCSFPMESDEQNELEDFPTMKKTLNMYFESIPMSSLITFLVLLILYLETVQYIPIARGVSKVIEHLLKTCCTLLVSMSVML